MSTPAVERARELVSLWDDEAASIEPHAITVLRDLLALFDGDVVTLITRGDGWHEARRGRTYDASDQVRTALLLPDEAPEVCGRCYGGGKTRDEGTLKVRPCPDCSTDSEADR